MGKGDKRTMRGKVFKGTFGKSRPKKKNWISTQTAKAAAAAAKKPADA